MSGLRVFVALLGFTLRATPNATLFFVPLILLYTVSIFFIRHGFAEGISATEYPSISSAFNEWYLVFCAQFALAFFMGGGKKWTSPSAVLPNAEFLVIKPISRRLALLAPITFFFLVMVSPALLRLLASLADPDLRFYIFFHVDRPNEASEHLNLYQAVFPNSSFIDNNMLVIPSGAILVAICETCLAFSFAALLQLTAICPLPKNFKLPVLATVSQIPLVLIFTNTTGTHTMAWESAFFFFAQHSLPLMLLTLGFVLSVQAFAFKQVRHLEVRD